MPTPKGNILKEVETLFNDGEWDAVLQMAAWLMQRLFYFARFLPSVRLPSPLVLSVGSQAKEVEGWQGGLASAFQLPPSLKPP